MNVIRWKWRCHRHDGTIRSPPLLWMVASSFKPENRIFADMTHGLRAFIPLDFTLENYRENAV